MPSQVEGKRANGAALVACSVMLLAGVNAAGVNAGPVRKRQRSLQRRQEDSGGAEEGTEERVSSAPVQTSAAAQPEHPEESTTPEQTNEPSPSPTQTSIAETSSTASSAIESTTVQAPTPTSEPTSEPTSSTTSTASSSSSSSVGSTTSSAEPVEPEETTAAPATSVVVVPPVVTTRITTTTSLAPPPLPTTTRRTTSPVEPSPSPVVEQPAPSPIVEQPQVPQQPSTTSTPTIPTTPADPAPQNPDPAPEIPAPEQSPAEESPSSSEPEQPPLPRVTQVRQFHQASSETVDWPALEIVDPGVSSSGDNSAPILPDWVSPIGNTNTNNGGSANGGAQPGIKPDVVGGDSSTLGSSGGKNNTTTIVVSFVACAFVAALVIGGLLYRRRRRNSTGQLDASTFPDDNSSFYSLPHPKGLDAPPPLDPFSLTPPRSLASRSNSTRSNKSTKSNATAGKLRMATEATKQKIIGALEVVKGNTGADVASNAPKDRHVPSILFNQPPPLAYYTQPTTQPTTQTETDKLSKDIQINDIILPQDSNAHTFSMLSDNSSLPNHHTRRRGSLPHYPSYMSYITEDSDEELEHSRVSSLVEGMTGYGNVVPVVGRVRSDTRETGKTSAGESQRSAGTFGHGLGSSPKGRHSRSLSDTSFVTTSSGSNDTMTRGSWRAPEDWDIKFDPLVLRNIGRNSFGVAGGVPYRGSIDVMKAVEAVRAAQGVERIPSAPRRVPMPETERPMSMESSICDSLDRVMASYGTENGRGERREVESWVSRGTVETDRTSASLSRYL
ncbi:hypothetical protein HK097_000723 [Rhizophlyctis rosea]|uniref:Uncharacterized protein n=1 Tax=Rhizophlyctis rosea TaxID=64517 RepID=A0AAD5S7J5_9FUNG|nr:hypothetical protein HK097_000723 [Rhizophlyctis rosea]